MRNFLRNTRRGWMVLHSPDNGGAAGGTNNLTLEQKLENALTDAHSARQLLEKRDGELSTAQAEVTRLQGQFDAATATATTSQADVTRLTSELATATSERDTARTDRDTANKNVERLESLCGLKGIDPKTAVKAPENEGGKSEGAKLHEEYSRLKASGDSKKATNFFRKNKDALRDYADSLG